MFEPLDREMLMKLAELELTRLAAERDSMDLCEHLERLRENQRTFSERLIMRELQWFHGELDSNELEAIRTELLGYLDQTSRAIAAIRRAIEASRSAVIEELEREDLPAMADYLRREQGG